MVLDVDLTLNLKIEVDNGDVERLNVDGYDIAMMLAAEYGKELVKAKRDDCITVKSWKID